MKFLKAEVHIADKISSGGLDELLKISSNSAPLAQTIIKTLLLRQFSGQIYLI